MCVCVCLSVLYGAFARKSSWRPAGVRPPGTAVTGNCESPDVSSLSSTIKSLKPSYNKEIMEYFLTHEMGEWKQRKAVSGFGSHFQAYRLNKHRHQSYLAGQAHVSVSFQ